MSLRSTKWHALWLSWLLVLTPGAQAGRAYVSNEDGETVSVLNTERGELIATISVGKRPRGLKLSRDGTRLYAAVSGLPKCPPTVAEDECAKLQHDFAADGIAVIDTATLKPVTVLKAGSDPGTGGALSRGRAQPRGHCAHTRSDTAATGRE